MKMRILVGVAVLALAGILMSRSGDWHVEPPPAWKKLVRTQGQFYPIPEEWISTDEGRIAHDLVLPDSVPKPVPFDFDKAFGPWYWSNSKWEVAKAYFDHLCSTEAGEWVFERPNGVEGIYFARSVNTPTGKYLSDVFLPEAPSVERSFHWMGEGIQARGEWFISPPFRNFRFVEEPWRDVEWQEKIYKPYIRLFGYTTVAVTHNPAIGPRWDPLSPMQVEGVPEVTADIAYTWRGIVRPRDREFQVAGSELIIYHRLSREIVAINRSFVIAQSNLDRNQTASWSSATSCSQGRPHDELFFTDFPVEVLLGGHTK